MKKIPIYQPFLVGNERKYVLDCLDTNWISSRGGYVQKFEEAFSNYLGNVKSTTCSNGTVALHLALLALDIGPGDEVIVPTFTYVASVNAIKYVGATPVFVDCDKATWNATLDSIRVAVTPATKAIMCVHIYGVPSDIESIVKYASENDLKVIEDCAEALGSRVNDVHVGCLSDISTFSFFGNKTITTGEGGMVVSRHNDLIEKVAHLKSQAVSPTIPYWHDCLGFNYRLTNIAAAIGLAQLENLPQILQKKEHIAKLYKDALGPSGVQFQEVSGRNRSSYWLNVIRIPTNKVLKRIEGELREHGVEIRPAFPLVSTMPHYMDLNSGEFPIAKSISNSALCLPSYPALKDSEVESICSYINNCFT